MPHTVRNTSINTNVNTSDNSLMPSFVHAGFSILFALFVLYAPFFPILFQEAGYTPNIHIRDYVIIGTLIFIALFFTCTCIYALRRRTTHTVVFPITALDWPIVAFFAFAALSILWGINFYESITVLVHWIGALVVFFGMRLWCRHETHVRIILHGVFFSGVFLAALGALQYIFFGHAWIDTFVVQAVPPAATLANKNMAVHMMSLTIPLGLLYMLENKSRLLKCGYAACCGLMLSFVLFTRTRAGWMALLITGIFFCVYLWYFRKKIAVHNPWRHIILALITLVIVIAVLLYLGENNPQSQSFAQRFKEAFEFNHSANTRLPIFFNSFAMLKDAPIFGVGLGNWTVHYPYYIGRIYDDHAFSLAAEHYHTHNDHLQILTETGIVGFALLAVLLGKLTVTVLRRIQRTEDSSHFLFAGVGLSVIAILINATFSFPFQLMQPTFIFAVYLGIISVWNMETVTKKGIPTTRRFSRTFSTGQTVCGSIFLICIAAIAITFAARTFARWNTGEQFFYQGMISWKANRPDFMVRAGLLGIEQHPDRYKLYDFIAGGLLLQNEPVKALHYFDKILSQYPYRLNTLHYKAQAQHSAGQKEQAYETISYLISLKPEYADGYKLRAQFHISDGNTAAAEQDLVQAINLSKYPDPLLVHHLAVMYSQSGQWDKAEQALVQTLAITPDWGVPYRNLGILYMNIRKEPQKGLSLLAKALELDPHIESAAEIRALLARARGETPPTTP